MSSSNETTKCAFLFSIETEKKKTEKNRFMSNIHFHFFNGKGSRIWGSQQFQSPSDLHFQVAFPCHKATPIQEFNKSGYKISFEMTEGQKKLHTPCAVQLCNRLLFSHYFPCYFCLCWIEMKQSWQHMIQLRQKARTCTKPDQ